jgi:hypothetical protein
VTAAPPFTVEIPDLSDEAIERIAELLVAMLDNQELSERTVGGEVPPAGKV